MWLKKVLKFFTHNASEERRGKVKFFNRKRGYGFIEPNNMEKDVFVHVTSLEDEISKGDRVAFEVKASSKGLKGQKCKSP